YQRIEKLLSGRINHGVEVGSHEQPSEGLTDRFLVVDDGDEGLGSRHNAAHEALPAIVANAARAPALDQSRIAVRPQDQLGYAGRPESRRGAIRRSTLHGDFPRRTTGAA